MFLPLSILSKNQQTDPWVRIENTRTKIHNGLDPQWFPPGSVSLTLMYGAADTLKTVTLSLTGTRVSKLLVTAHWEPG